jgi:hypothetical protein
MEINHLKELLVKFSSDIKFNHELKKKIGLILEESLKYFIKLITLEI